MAKYVGILKSIKRSWDEYSNIGTCAIYRDSKRVGFELLKDTQVDVGVDDNLPGVTGAGGGYFQSRTCTVVFPTIEIFELFGFNQYSGKITPSMMWSEASNVVSVSVDVPGEDITKEFILKIDPDNNIHSPVEITIKCTVPARSVRVWLSSDGTLEFTKVVKPLKIFIPAVSTLISGDNFCQYSFKKTLNSKKILYLSEDLKNKVPINKSSFLSTLRNNPNYLFESSDAELINDEKFFASDPSIYGASVRNEDLTVDSKLFYLEE